jgi:hypothetical protein
MNEYSEKPPEPEGWPLSLCYPLHCWWCWRALTAAMNFYLKSLHCADHHPIKIFDERGEWEQFFPWLYLSRGIGSPH